MPAGVRPKVVLDSGNGTAALFATELFRSAGCDVIPVFCDPDATFPNHEPNPSDIDGRETLIRLVRESGAMLGLSFDGDGDRLGIVDDKGENVWSDLALALLAEPLLKARPGAPVVFDVKCTAALPEQITRFGGTPVMWKTGHSNIKAKCHETNAALGGERSGHIFFCDGFYGFDDGLFSGLKFVESVAHKNQPLSELIPAITNYITSPEIHVDCPDEKKYGVIEQLQQELKAEYGGENVVDINGARVTFGSGWGLVRASSNLPQLVLVFEAKSEDELSRIKDIFRKKLLRFPEVAKEWDNE